MGLIAFQPFDRLARRAWLKRTGALTLASLALAAPTRSRAGFNFFTSEYTASRAELERALAKQFPQQRGYGALIQVELSQPELTLDAAANRVKLSLNLAIRSALLQAAPIPGTTTLSSALRFDRESLSLRLEQPRAEHLQLAGITGRDAERLQKVAAAVAQELLQDQPLHTFQQEDLTVGRKVYQIGDITVLPDAIKVQLL